MKRLFLSLLAVITVSSVLVAQNNNVCERATYVDDDFYQEMEVGDHWFVSTSYDLPLTLYYIPDNKADKLPKVSLDFTCTPGVYDDPKLADLIRQAASDYDIHFPISETWKKTELEGDEAYAITFDRTVRNLLSRAGIKYQVPAYMCFTSYGKGKISIKAASLSNNCQKQAVTLQYIAKQPITLDDTATVFSWPLGDWIDYNYILRWDGKEPLSFYFGKECEINTAVDSTYYKRYILTSSSRVLMTKESSMEILADLMSTDVYVRLNTKSEGTLYIEEVDTCVYLSSYLIAGVYAQINEKDSSITAVLPQGTDINAAIASAQVAYTSPFEEIWRYNATRDSLIIRLKAYSLNISVAPDTKDYDATLLSLSVDGVEYTSFSSSQQDYTIQTDSELPKLTCTTRSSKAKAVVENVSKVPGTAKIRVTAEAGNTFTYTVHFTRPKNSDASLSLITIDGTAVNGFSPTRYTYSKDIIKMPIVTAIPTVNTARVYIRQILEVPGTARIYVTAESGDVLIYSINFALDARVKQCEEQTPELGYGKSMEISKVNEEVVRINTNTMPANKVPVRFLWTGKEPLSIYIGTTCGFDPLTATDELLAQYTLTPWRGFDIYRLQLTAYELSQLGKKTLDGNLYLRFVGQDAGTLTFEPYEPSCDTRSLVMEAKQTTAIPQNNFAQVYALYLPDWEEKDMEVRWDGASTLEMFIADTCDFLMQPSNVHLLADGYHSLATAQSFEITRGVVSGWLQRCDMFAYVRVLNGAQGQLTISVKRDYNDSTEQRNYYTLTLLASPLETGSFVVIDEKNDTIQQEAGVFQIEENQRVAAYIIPAEHYSFRSWSDGSALNPRTILMNGNKEYTALFEPLRYALEVTCDPTQGRVSGTGRYAYLQEVTIEAVANRGYRFLQWSDAQTDNPRVYVVEGNAKIEALFVDEHQSAPAIESDPTQPRKIIRDQQIVILMPDGRLFTPLGQIVER